MKIDFPIPAQGMDMARLWQEAFGDSFEFIEGFFCTAYSPARCRCVTIGGEVAAVLYWLDTEYDGQRFAYIYAVATKKSHRGKGLCRLLMEDTHTHLQGRGYAGALLVPQTAALREMYAAFGYRSCTTVSETFCAAGDVPAELHRIDAEEYARLRREFLPRSGVVQEGENLRFLETQVQFFRGPDFLLAAQKAEEDTLFGTELLGSADTAPGILKALGYRQGTFRTPGQKQDFAMFLPLAEGVLPPDYFGIPFD